MNSLNLLVKTDDIAAISTGGGLSAIAVIRCSGQNVFEKIDKIFRAKNSNQTIQKSRGYTQIYGTIFDNNEIIDDVIISIFKNPHSFTGENTIEISCHGSTFIQTRIMELLTKTGIRPAAKGEFTMRAWQNGKMDLTQAEAIADLIDSNNKYSHQVAMGQLRGNFSNVIKKLREDFIHFASLIELELDFAEEDLEFADRTNFLELIHEIDTKIDSLIESYKIGKALKNGIPVAIIGKPNVGKSTLLNFLLNDEKAITSEIPGTTRDIIEDTVVIDGFLFRFIDTAGIRQSDDLIENLGIERTYKTIKDSSIVLYMTDEQGFKTEDLKRIEEYLLQGKHVIKIQNKIDKLTNLTLENDIIAISAKEKLNTNGITEGLLSFVKKFKISDQSIITSTRHAHLLEQTKEDLHRIKNAFEIGIPTDLIMIDVRSAMQHLGDITGEIVVDDLLSNIFSKFCIGK